MQTSFVLMSVDQGIHDTTSVIDAAACGLSSGEGWSVRMQRLSGGLSDGVDVVWLNNGCTRIALLPTRGMGVWKAESAGLPLEWKSPVERPVNPAFVDPMRRGGIGWLDGFNELICRCGLGWNGAPGTDKITDESGKVVSEQFLPLHGRIANLPAHEVTVEIADDGAISVVGVVDESSMFGGRLRLISRLTTYPGSTSFEIMDEVRNPGSSPAEVEMLYHCNFGRPLLEGNSVLHIAASEIVPRNARAAEGIATWNRYTDPEPGYAEQVYFARPIADESGRGLAVLSNADADRGVAVRFDVDTLPWFSVWKNTQAEADGYCTGLEPGSSFPNLKTFERRHGRVISLPSDAEVTFRLAFTAAIDSEDVRQLVAEVAELQSGRPMVVTSKPRPDWCDC
ncbi:MAG: aldose 1-epimerase family protein [Planctomycetaceae bacterium]